MRIFIICEVKKNKCRDCPLVEAIRKALPWHPEIDIECFNSEGELAEIYDQLKILRGDAP